MNIVRNMVLACVVMVLCVGLFYAGKGSPIDEQAGCAGTPSGQLIAPSEQLGLCVLQAAVSDLVDAIGDPASLVPAIVAACAQYGVATAQAIWTVISEYLGARPANDSGVALSTAQTMRLTRVMLAAQAATGAGK